MNGLTGRRNFLGTMIAIPMAVRTDWLRANPEQTNGGVNATVPSSQALPMAKRTYHHAYHQCLVYKIHCANKEDADKILIDFEGALQHIRKMHGITGGMKQIVYLVGWQFDGHDSKYPAWSEVNRRLKRPGDSDARASLLWLAQEAKKFNAWVSVHINISDAYENSPLWKEYLDKGLLELGKDGRPVKGGVWGGETSYHINKTREWESGYTQKRIDGLLTLLPFLRESGTVHIDALGIIGRSEKRRQTYWAIFDYWYGRGIDVTSEYFDFDLAGRLPMVWHLNVSEAKRLKYPPEVICGGGDACNQRLHVTMEGWKHLPEAGCLYEEAWGVSIERSADAESRTHMVDKFCRKTLVWYFLNRHRALSYEDGTDLYRVTFSGDVETSVRKSDRHLTVRDRGRVLVDGGDLLVPALWTANGEWFAYSKKGGTRTWPVPDAWTDAKRLTAVALTDEGRGAQAILSVQNGTVEIALKPGEGVAISKGEQG